MRTDEQGMTGLVNSRAKAQRVDKYLKGREWETRWNSLSAQLRPPLRVPP